MNNPTPIKINPRVFFGCDAGLLARMRERYEDLQRRGVQPKGLPKGKINDQKSDN